MNTLPTTGDRREAARRAVLFSAWLVTAVSGTTALVAVSLALRNGF